MNTQQLIRLNIDNVTSLWKLGAMAAGSFYSNDHYAIALDPHSNWPNKLWFHGWPDHGLLQELQHKWNLQGISVAVWQEESEPTHRLLEQHGFRLKSQLTGMSMSLAYSLQQEPQRVHLQRVSDASLAHAWAEQFQLAFNYLIAPRTVVRTMQQVDYFVARVAGTPVGTVSLYQHTDNTVGIHSMGVVPDHRRKGLAEEMLLQALHLARQKGAIRATLQASDMGKGLYLRTGFQDDFKLKLFIIN